MELEAFAEQRPGSQGAAAGMAQAAAGEDGVHGAFEEGQAVLGEAPPAFRCGPSGDEQAQALFLLMAALFSLPVDLAEFEQAEVRTLVVAVPCNGVEPLENQGLAKGVQLGAQGVQERHGPIGLQGDILHEGQLSGRDERIVHGLVEPPGHEDAGPLGTQLFGVGIRTVGQAHLHAPRQRNVVVAVDAKDFLHHIGGTGHVAAISGHLEAHALGVLFTDGDVEVRQDATDPVAVEGDADPLVHGGPLHADFRCGGGRAFGALESTFDRGTRMGDQQVDRLLEARSGRHGVDAAFEAEGCIGGQGVPFGALANGNRLEPGAFQEDPGGRLGHTGVRAAENAGEAHRAVRVGDDQVGLAQLQRLAFEGGEGFTALRPAHPNHVAGDAVGVEGVEGLAEVVEDVVRDVHHVVLRLDANGPEPLLHPVRRRAHLNAGQGHPQVDRGTVGILNVDGDRA